MRDSAIRSVRRLALTLLASQAAACNASEPANTTLRILPALTITVDVSTALSMAPSAAGPSAPNVSPYVCSSGESKRVGACFRLGNAVFRIWGAARSGKMPKALAADHASRRLYSSNMGAEGEQGLSVFRTEPLRLERHVPMIGNAIELFVSRDDRSLWITDMRDWGKLQHYDTNTWELVREFAVPGFPKWMTPDSSESNFFVSLWTWDGVSRVDVAQGTVATSKTRRGKVSGRHSKNPRGLALSSDERQLYVLNNHDHTLSVMDATSLVEKERVAIGYAPRHIVPGHVPDTFFVSLTGEDALVEWSASQRKITRRFPVGKRPKTIAVSHDGRYAFAANFVGNSLSVVELATGHSRELPLGLHKPSGLAVRADDRFVYVSGFCSNDVWAIERIDDGQLPTPTDGDVTPHRPCPTCASTFAGCPFPPGVAPFAVGNEKVKTDAEWGWTSH